MKVNTQKHPGKLYTLLWQVHLKTSSWVANLIGPMVFSFGPKEEPWKLSTADLLQFPEGSVGKALGEFLKKDKLEPIARAESHDVIHVLFDFSVTLKDEVALQFFLRGNGQTSIASFGTSIGAWFIFPRQWTYLRNCYKRGKECADISRLNFKALLHENMADVRSKLIKK